MPLHKVSRTRGNGQRETCHIQGRNTQTEGWVFPGGRECPGLSQAPHPVHIAYTDCAQTARPAQEGGQQTGQIRNSRAGPYTRSQRPRHHSHPAETGCPILHCTQMEDQSCSHRQLPLKKRSVQQAIHKREENELGVCHPHLVRLHTSSRTPRVTQLRDPVSTKSLPFLRHLNFSHQLL